MIPGDGKSVSYNFIKDLTQLQNQSVSESGKMFIFLPPGPI